MAGESSAAPGFRPGKTKARIDHSDLTGVVCMLPKGLMQQVNTAIKQVLDILKQRSRLMAIPGRWRKGSGL
jgi:hypothetical protein